MNARSRWTAVLRRLRETLEFARARVLAVVLFAVSGTCFAANGLVGAWGLNGVAGTTEADYSGNNNRGSVTGAVPTAAGKFGNALVFGGTESWVDLGLPAVLQITGSMTVSAWINSSALPVDDAAIVSSADFNGARGFQLDTTVDTGPRTIGFKLFDLSGAPMTRYGTTALPLNQWVHVAGVYDAQAQTMTVYLNGVPDNGALAGTVASSQLPSTVRNVLIGQRADSGTYGFIGEIDEVRIYSRALSQAEIQADMNAAIAPPAPDALAPSTPLAFAGSAASTSQINLEWIGSSDDFDVAAYRVERCQGAGCANFAEVAAALDTSFNDAGLAPGTSYSYRVRASDESGNFSGYSNVASAATLAAPPPGGRVGAYPFEEGSGTTTADFSGLNNTGALSGPAWTTAGEIGNALVFDGNGSVDLGHPGTLQLPGSMTVSAWINSSAFPVDDAAIVSSADFNGARGFQLDTTVDTGPRTIGFKLFDPSGSLMIRYGATALPLNQWVHVAGAYDAQAQTMTVYLNGAPDNGALAGTVAASQHPSLLNVLIGQRADSGAYGFIGTIDEVRIYNRALSQAEIQADMSSSATSVSLSLAPAGQGSGGGVDVTALVLQQGGSGTLVATISAPQSTDTSISIASSAAAVASVPASVLVPAGSVSASFAVTAVSPGTADVTASLPGSSATVQVIIQANVGVTVDASIDGSVVSSDTEAVSGTLSGPSNTGITVNGVVAAIVGNTFVVPDIPLQPGTNTLTIVVTTPTGQTSTSTITVNSTGPAPIEVSASPAQGTAPLGVTFTINNRTPNAIQSVQADYLGTGSFVTANPSSLSNNYTAPGIYQAKFTITDSTGATFQQTVPIAVQDSAQIDQMLRTTWTGFTGALTAQNMVAALQSFNAQAQVKYGPVLSALLPDLPQIVTSFSAPQLVSISGDIGEYAINRTIHGVDQIFFIYFFRDIDGVWRLDSM